MNDITALVATMKAAAEKAKEFGEERLYVKAGNVLALVEALEKAQRKAAIFDLFPDDYVITNGPMELIEKQAKRIAELGNDLAAEEERRSNWFRMAEELGGKLDAAEERIRELESRTVTVKLPKRKTGDDYNDDVYDEEDLAALYNACRLECLVKFKNACRAAGIQVIEGEGQ